MLRVAALQFFADFEVSALPKTCELLSKLNGLAAGRQQLKQQGRSGCIASSMPSRRRETEARASGSPSCDTSHGLALERILRPEMLRVSALQFFADFGVSALPKTCEILSKLNGLEAGR